jgi:hypothetical protein
VDGYSPFFGDIPKVKLPKSKILSIDTLGIGGNRIHQKTVDALN